MFFTDREKDFQKFKYSELIHKWNYLLIFLSDTKLGIVPKFSIASGCSGAGMVRYLFVNFGWCSS